MKQIKCPGIENTHPGGQRPIVLRTKHAFTLLCFLLCVLCAFAVQMQAQQIHLPPVTRATLPNGTQILLAEYKRAPTLTLLAIFPDGGVADPAGKAGVASLTSTLMLRGTEKRTAQQIAEETDFLGGSLDAGADDERLTVSLNVLAKDTDAGLDLLEDITRHATFAPEELERERQLELAGLQSLGEDMRAIASRVANQTVYGSHPYGAEPAITSLTAITRDDVRNYYKGFVAPDRMILVAVGDFNAPEMLAKLKAKFGDWPRSNQPAVTVPPVAPSAPRVVLIDKPDATQTQVRFVRTAISRSSPDYFPAMIAETILGGGFTSRLTDEIRVNRSLTYGISSRFGEQKQGGEFLIATFTKIETTRDIIEATQNVLKKTAEQGFSTAELKKVNGFIAGQFAIALETPQALASQLANAAFYGLPDDYLATSLTKMQAVSLADINRVAKMYFAPDSLSLVLVAPAAKVKSQLSALKNIETRPVESVAK